MCRMYLWDIPIYGRCCKLRELCSRNVRDFAWRDGFLWLLELRSRDFPAITCFDNLCGVCRGHVIFGCWSDCVVTVFNLSRGNIRSFKLQYLLAMCHGPIPIDFGGLKLQTLCRRELLLSWGDPVHQLRTWHLPAGIGGVDVLELPCGKLPSEPRFAKLLELRHGNVLHLGCCQLLAVRSWKISKRHGCDKLRGVQRGAQPGSPRCGIVCSLLQLCPRILLGDWR